MYCAQRKPAIEFLPTFSSNAAAHILHLGSAQCSLSFAFCLTSLALPRVLAVLLRSPFLFPTASMFGKPIKIPSVSELGCMLARA